MGIVWSHMRWGTSGPPPPPSTWTRIPAWTRSVHQDAPGQRHGQQPVSGTADPGVVKQDKSSRGCVDTTKTRSGPQRVRMSSGERPIGAAKGKQSDTEALCQTPVSFQHHWHAPDPHRYLAAEPTAIAGGPQWFRTCPGDPAPSGPLLGLLRHLPVLLVVRTGNTAPCGPPKGPLQRTWDRQEGGGKVGNPWQNQGGLKEE